LLLVGIVVRRVNGHVVKEGKQRMGGVVGKEREWNEEMEQKKRNGWDG